MFWGLGHFFLAFYWLANLATAETAPNYFNKDSLVQLIREKGISSVEKLLAQLPTSMRMHYALVFESLSLQQADYLNPRVLLTNEDASFVMTFNGLPEQYGYETIETLQFRAPQAKFELEEFVFSKDKEARVRYLKRQNKPEEVLAIETREGRQGVNPPLCLACHRSDPRPNWEQYPLWVGMYGQFNDEFGSRKSAGRFDNRLAIQPLEEFARKASRHPRYKHLLELRARLNLDDNFRIKSGKNPVAPLTRLTQNLNRHNFQRIVRIFRENKNYLKLRYVLLGLLADCQDRVDHKKNPNFYTGKIVRTQERPFSFTALNLSTFINLFASYDIPAADLFMNFRPGPHNMMRTPGIADEELTFALVQSDPELKSLGFLFRELEAGIPPHSTYRALLAKPLNPQTLCAKVFSETNVLNHS